MKIGLATNLSDPAAIVARCREVGVRHVTMRAAAMPGAEEAGAPDLAAMREIQARLAGEGIAISAMIAWFGSDAGIVLDPSGHRRHLDAALRTLEVQGKLGIDTQLHYVDVAEPEDPAEDERYWDGLLSVYRELVAQAEASRVKLANHGIWRCLPDGMREDALGQGVKSENYRHYRPPDWRGPYLVRTADHVRRLIDEVPSDYNGAAMCTGMYITGADPVAEIPKFKGKINFVQIRDLDGHWPAAREVFPGTGDLDFPLIIRALREAGYARFMHPEHLGHPRHQGEDLELAATELLKEWVAGAEGAQ